MKKSEIFSESTIPPPSMQIVADFVQFADYWPHFLAPKHFNFFPQRGVEVIEERCIGFIPSTCFYSDSRSSRLCLTVVVMAARIQS
ncbi:unnamed protein product [Clavelina lepadiformis]|uniref:Uncharacterized protein n=1 Tax=Clavelina lepadiformis TaxID=159417 RepID=A0ABP0FVR0_CLALP